MLCMYAQLNAVYSQHMLNLGSMFTYACMFYIESKAFIVQCVKCDFILGQGKS